MSFFHKTRHYLNQHSFFQDSWVISFLVAGLMVIIFQLVWSFSHIHQTDLPMPVHFTSLQNFELGNWYELYGLVTISAVTYAINLLLGLLLYKKNRLVAIFLLFISLLVAILSTVILFGFTAVNYGSI